MVGLFCRSDHHVTYRVKQQYRFPVSNKIHEQLVLNQSMLRPVLNKVTSTNSRASHTINYMQRLSHLSSQLDRSPHVSQSRKMGSLGVYQKKHKVAVVGSGNWYVIAIVRSPQAPLIQSQGHHHCKGRRREHQGQSRYL